MLNSILEEDLIKFLKNNIEPYDDQIYGKTYRASVTLTDETYLPCVIFRNSKPKIDLAIKRFKDEQGGNSIFKNKSKGSGYREIVKNFIISGNNLNFHHIANIEKSSFAIPLSIVRKIDGETAMSWTAFVIKFKNGQKASFGTSWNWEFFSKPDGFDFDDIEEIISGAYLDKNGEIIFHKSIQNYNEMKDLLDVTYREKPFFECYLDNL
ncbi:hypothetical protein [Epilithonimonas arachidiradicis]|uniref:Uncharacterized protein n=1 Tax=Epilithonimonas arachidiradicis TaxID=1617282 RepID=A0A420D9R8_9FLAO|nr:hypothetical protein [Epilithonimonas arachidiradicis]RKE87700.1 hypothetical protein BXY58_1832 [Epilithonimonas arachidiradicis]GGG57243.1 hypothetical protein GCM10007332_18680 [Epilithonimonas arachidiradicis]